MRTINQFKFSIRITKEKDLEIKAIASSHIGKIYFQCLNKHENASYYFRQSLRFCESLKPKLFTQFQWHKDMLLIMDTINKEKLKKESQNDKNNEKIIR